MRSFQHVPDNRKTLRFRTLQFPIVRRVSINAIMSNLRFLKNSSGYHAEFRQQHAVQRPAINVNTGSWGTAVFLEKLRRSFPEEYQTVYFTPPSNLTLRYTTNTAPFRENSQTFRFRPSSLTCSGECLPQRNADSPKTLKGFSPAGTLQTLWRKICLGGSQKNKIFREILFAS